MSQVDVSDDGFLNLLTDSGDEKNDVKVPDGDVGDKIKKLFTEEEKDVSMCNLYLCAVVSHTNRF